MQTRSIATLLAVTAFVIAGIKLPAQTTYDMLDYMVNDYGATEHLVGASSPYDGHPMRTYYIDANNFRYIKDNNDGVPTEVYQRINDSRGDNIYIKYENGQRGCTAASTNTGTDYRWYADGTLLWTPRTVWDDQTFVMDDFRELYSWLENGVENRKFHDAVAWANKVEIVSKNLGGTLGTRSNLVKLMHARGTSFSSGDYEAYYYDQEYGLVLWEWVTNNQIANPATDDAYFNTPTSGTFGYSGPWPADDNVTTSC